MRIGRTTFFIILSLILLTPFLATRINWLLNSKKTNGEMSFIGRRYTGQIGHVYSVIRFETVTDTIFFNGSDNVIFEPGEKVEIRYQPENPRDARVNTFTEIWGDTLVYGGLPLLVLLFIAFHPEIIPYNSRIYLDLQPPFLKIV